MTSLLTKLLNYFPFYSKYIELDVHAFSKAVNENSNLLREWVWKYNPKHVQDFPILLRREHYQICRRLVREYGKVPIANMHPDMHDSLNRYFGYVHNINQVMIQRGVHDWKDMILFPQH
ncbi:MAG: hypothetical protein WCK90_05180 [archaeon]